MGRGTHEQNSDRKVIICAVIPGESAQLLPLPRHFGQLAELVTEDMVSAPCGPDPQPYVEAIRTYQEAGFDEVYLGQVGGRLERAFHFLATQVLPRCGRLTPGHPGRLPALRGGTAPRHRLTAKAAGWAECVDPHQSYGSRQDTAWGNHDSQRSFGEQAVRDGVCSEPIALSRRSCSD